MHECFQLTWLSSSSIPSVSECAHLVLSPLEGCLPGLLRLVRGLPTLHGEASLSRLLTVLRRRRLTPVGDPTFRHDDTSEHDVGHPLISLLDLIGHRPR